MEWSLVVLGLGAGLLMALVVDAERRRRGASSPASEPEVAPALSARFASLTVEVERVQGLVTELQRERVAEHSALMTRLDAADRTDVALRSATDSLVRTFANPVTRGRWGERSAADVLRRGGLVEGVNFERQRTLAGGARPDITFFLPHGRMLHLDVKFPADNYVRHVECTDETESQRSRVAFLADVGSHLKELARRGYTEGRDSVDHQILYVPSEAIYGFICEHAPPLVDDALDRGVIMCSPFTLLSVVAVVREAVEQFCLEQRTHEIIEALGAFDRQWRLFGASLDRVDRHLTTLDNSFAELTGPRRRGLEGAASAMSLRSGLDDSAPHEGPD